MIYLLYAYATPKKFLLPGHHIDTKEQNTVQWLRKRTKIGYKILLYFHNYALLLIFVMVTISYAWFMSLLNYVNSTKNNMVLGLYPFFLMGIVVFHGKYREVNRITFQNCINKTIALQGVSGCIALLIILIKSIHPKSSFIKYFILEEAIIQNGTILYSVNYSNKKTLYLVINFSIFIYVLKICFFFLRYADR